MDEEEKKMLEHTLKLVQENHAMLRKVRGVQKRATLFSMIYWILIIGAAIGAFYFIQPYVNQVQQALKVIGVNTNKFSSSTLQPKQ